MILNSHDSKATCYIIQYCPSKSFITFVVVVVITQQLFSYPQLSRLRKSVTAARMSHSLALRVGSDSFDMPLVMWALYVDSDRNANGQVLFHFIPPKLLSTVNEIPPKNTKPK